MMNPRPHPKFSVGEDVLIYSMDTPEIWGFETTIIEAYFGDCEVPPDSGRIREGWSYEVSPDPSGYGWMEQALRKKPEPSQMSLRELMQSLNTPAEEIQSA